MEIVVRTDNTETVVRPEASAQGTSPGAAPQAPAGMDARGATSAGEAPSAPGQSGVPPANVAATEPPRAATGADQSAGGAPALS